MAAALVGLGVGTTDGSAVEGDGVGTSVGNWLGSAVVGAGVGDGVGVLLGSDVGSCVGDCVVNANVDPITTLSNVLVPDSEAVVAIDEASDPELTATANAALTAEVTSSSCCDDESTATVVVIVAADVWSVRRLRLVDEVAHLCGAKLEALTPGIFCASARFITSSSTVP